jgi:hypothetical protein
MKKRFWIILGALVVGGLVIAGILYRTFPVEMTTYGGMALNYLRTLSTPAGTVSTEANPAYKGAVASASAPPPADSAWPNAAAGDWPSYNRTPSSQRYSPLSQITTKNVGKLKVLCAYDLGEFTAFETSLIMVDNALIGASEYDIFSLNPATCAENWRTHLDYPGSLLPANRGVAYMDGMLFRGTQDARVLAFDFKTGKQLWETRIGDTKRGETVPGAPIAWDGTVYIGNAGGDFKGGKGHMYALAPSVLLELVGGQVAAAIDENVVGNLIYMVEMGRYDLYSLFHWITKHLSDNPPIVAEISTEERAAPDTVNLAMATVLETLRVNQAEAVVRRVVENITFDGWGIPKGGFLRACIREGHRDPAVFPNPDQFDPQRFMGRKYGPAEYSPFGFDHHHCIASDLVIQLGSIFVEELVHSFYWQVLADGPCQRGTYHWTPSGAFAIRLMPHDSA